MAAEIILAKVNGANQASQLLSASGKTFTVGKISAVGGGMGNMLALTPATGATVAKAAAGSAVTAKTVAMTTPIATQSTAAGAGKAAAGATIAKTAAAGGIIWKGTGLSLGLGLGLGAWGPLLLAGVGATAIYGKGPWMR